MTLAGWSEAPGSIRAVLIAVILVCAGLVSAHGAGAQPALTALVSGTDGEGVTLRAEASQGSASLAVEPEGAVLTVLGPEQVVNGRAWRPVRDAQGRTGWVAAAYLLIRESPSPVPAPISVPTIAESNVTPLTPVTRAAAPSPAEPGTAEPATTPGPPLTLEIRFKYPEVDRRDRQEMLVDVTRQNQPVPGVIVRFVVDDEDPPVEREGTATNEAGRSVAEWSVRKYRGSTRVHVQAEAPDGGLGNASRDFFVR